MNLLNLLRKSHKMPDKPHILSLFLNLFNKFNKTWSLMYNPLCLQKLNQSAQLQGLARILKILIKQLNYYAVYVVSIKGTDRTECAE